MKHRILVVGNPALTYARDGIADYLQRLRRFGHFELEILKDGSPEQVEKRFLSASEGTRRVVLDERGEHFTSRTLASKIENWIQDPGCKAVTYLIGPADGHTELVRGSADLVLALSKLTLQHELATLMLAEQLYRVASIHAGTPYHRD